MPVDHYPNPGALPPIAPGVPSELPVVPRATVWPRRLGILAIVVGVLGVLGGVMGSSVATQTKIIEVLLPKDVTADPQAVRTAAAWKAWRRHRRDRALSAAAGGGDRPGATAPLGSPARNDLGPSWASAGR